MVACMPGAATPTALATPAGGTPGHPGGGADAGTPASAGFHLAAELAAVASSVHRGSSARSGSALEAATPATLARRPLDRPARYSLVASGTLLDMERWVARLERWGLEAGTLLSSYQQTVAELEDRHSAALVACQAQLRCLTAELASAQSTAAATQQELQALQVSHQAELANERAAAALQLQLRDTQHDAELGKVRAALDRSTSELAGARERQEAALHQAALARAARDRASAENARREDEVVGLRVRLEGLEASLGEYRAENAKAAGMKARYKAIIGELEASLGAKEREKSALVAMCDELMTTLERERQQLARQQAPR
ncbi:hypothetical protein F751_3263 [Auxenochlorella protothecoides]|uniref:Uncharacterized protein n=2 Tax=Auxenochlorella protothecoides TaxID=3075 RepID=A0A087STX8_AUXPR|nr:hypothetical protein F751_3263 [Auxenochlorella protothecoides]KFM29182.1 hypothetical protein F751_3263 [Auxenochlorella protothecoides]